MVDRDTTTEALKIGAKLVYGIYTLVVLSIVCAFGVGVFFATTNSNIKTIREDVAEMRESLTKDVMSRLRRVEEELAERRGRGH